MKYLLRIITSAFILIYISSANISAAEQPGEIRFGDESEDTVICNSQIIPKITNRSDASGITGVLTYSWEKSVSTDNLTWSDFETINDSSRTELVLTGLAEGNYRFKRIVTDEYSVSYYTDYIVIRVKSATPPAVSLIATEPSCNNNDGRLTADIVGGTTPYAFRWSLADSTRGELENLPAANYTLKLSDAEGCTVSADISLSTYPTLSIIAVNATQPVCDAANAIGRGAVSIVATGGNGTLEYSIGGAFQNQNTFAELAPDEYTITVRDASFASCTTSSTTFDINTITKPTVEFSSITSASCEHDGRIAAKGTGGKPLETATKYNYSWSGISGTQTSDSTWTDLAGGNYTVTITDANNCSDVATHTMPAYPALSIIAVNTTQPLCDAANAIGRGAVSIVATGGNGTLEYSIGGAFQNQNTFAELSPDEYKITVRDASFASCTTSTTFDINTITKPTVEFSSITSASCEQDGRIAAKGTGGKPLETATKYNYSWSGISGTQTSDSTWTDLAGGNYTVTITDANNCSDAVTHTMPAYPTLSIIAVNATQPVCDAANAIGKGAVSIVATGGNGTLEYSIGGAFQNQNTFAELSPDEYTITVRDASFASCTTSTTFDINAITKPTVEFSSLLPSCKDNDGQLTANITHGTGSMRYLWSNGKTTAKITDLPGSTYSVTVTDDNNCLTEKSEILNKYVPLANNPTTINPHCDGTGAFINGSYTFSMTGGSGAYKYEYDSQEHAFGSISTVSELNNITTSINVIDANYAQCSLVNTVKINYLAKLESHISYISHPGCALSNGRIQTYTIHGQGAYRFDWTLAQDAETWTGENISNLKEGIYTLVATDGIGCKSSVSAQLIAASPEGLSVAINSKTLPTCKDNGAISVSGLGGKAPYTFKLYNETTGTSILFSEKSDVNSHIFNNLPAGTFSIAMKDGNSCYAYSMSDIALPANSVKIDSIGHFRKSCSNENSILVYASGGNIPYSYSMDNNTFSNTYTFSNISVGSKNIYIKDKNNCSDEFLYIVKAPESPELTVSEASKVSCFGGADALLSATVSKGEAPYTYSWTGTDILGNVVKGPNSPNFDNLRAGAYQLSVIDNRKCTALSSSKTVSQNAQIISVAVVSDVAIYGQSTGSVSVTASGGIPSYTYKWNNNATGASITALPAGIYTVTITDSKHCSITQTDTVKNKADKLQPGVIEVNGGIAGSKICGTETAPAIISQTLPTGGSGTNSFAWYASTDLSAWKLVAGATDSHLQANVPDFGTTYFKRKVMAGNGDTAVTAAVSITRNPSPILSISILESSYCANDKPVLIYATPSGSNGHYIATSGLTDNGMGTATVNPALFESGLEVQYTYTDHNNCQNSLAKSVIINDSVPIGITINEVIAFNSASESIAVIPDGGILSGPGVYSAGKKFFPRDAGKGTHQIWYHYTDAKGCVWKTSKPVLVQDAPANIALGNGHGSVFCVDEEPIQLMADSPIDSIASFDGPGAVFHKGDLFATFTPHKAGDGNHTINMSFYKGVVLYNVNRQLTVVDLGDPSIIGLKSEYCESSEQIVLQSKTSGGLFSGNNVASGKYSPILSESRNRDTVVYILLDNVNKCYKYDTTFVSVNKLPVLDLSDTRTIFNVNESSTEMTAAPAGGMFSINTLPQGTSTQFAPHIYKTGEHLVSYKYEDAKHCVQTTDTIFKVLGVDAIFKGVPHKEICLEADSVKLYIVGDTLGGMSAFGGQGISNHRNGDTVYFIPRIAMGGIHPITYTYHSPDGKAQFIVNDTITVIDPATPVLVGTEKEYCDGATATVIATVNGIQQQGIFTNASSLSTISHGSILLNLDIDIDTLISFRYTDSYGCSDSVSAEITINPLPIITGISLLPFYNKEDLTANVSGHPSGGSFSADGIVFTGNTFNPSTAEVRTHVVKYTLVSNKSCVSETTDTMEIIAPSVHFSSSKGELDYCRVEADSAEITVLVHNFADNAPIIGTFEIIPGIIDMGENKAKIFPDKIQGDSINLTFRFTSPDGKTVFTAVKKIIIETPSAMAFIDPKSIYCTTDNDQIIQVNNPKSQGNHAFELIGYDNALVANNSASIIMKPSSLDTGKYTIAYTYTSVNGCISKASTDFNVLSGQPLAFELKSVFNINETAILLEAKNVPAIFTGTDATVTESKNSYYFNPSRAIDSIQTVRCSYSDVNGCISILEKSTSVFKADATFSAIDSLYCDNDDSVRIAVTARRPYANGRYTIGTKTFEGDKLTFSPSDFNPGVNTVRFIYTDIDSLANFEIDEDLSIFSFGTLSIGGLADVYCQDSVGIKLIGLPTGGVFSGSGIRNNVFNPVWTNEKTVTVNYSMVKNFVGATKTKTCRDSAKQQLTVHPLPIIKLQDFNKEYIAKELQICENDTLIFKSSKSGGKFSGPSIFQDADSATYTPSAKNVGKKQMILLTYTDGNSCTGHDSVKLDVKPLPIVSIGGVKAAYCAIDEPVELIGQINLIASSEGIFKGAGVSYETADSLIAIFNPAAIAEDDKAGHTTIHYSVTTEFGCSSVALANSTVYPMPQLSLTNYKKEYCFGASPTELIGSHFGENAKYTINDNTSSTNKTLTFTNDTVRVLNIAFEYTKDNCKSKIYDTVRINPLPAINFSINSLCLENPIEFVNTTTSENTISEYMWKFSDKTENSDTILSKDASYKFSTTGNHKVSLTATTDKHCSDTKALPLQLFSEPNVSIHTDIVCGEDSPVLFFTKDIDTSLYQFSWNFGDGTSSSMVEPSHLYRQPGRYIATLEVNATNRCRTMRCADILVKPVVGTYPHVQDFEAGEAGWHQPQIYITPDSAQMLGTWELAEPSNSILNAAHSGKNAWNTNATGKYLNDEQSYIESPCFDLNTLSKPMLKFNMKMITEQGRDGLVIQIKKGLGEWEVLGDNKSGIDWYNTTDIGGEPGGQRVYGWTGDMSDRWHSPRVALDKYLDTVTNPNYVQFRFAFGSDQRANNEGVVIDDFWIGDRERLVLVEQFVSASSESSASIAANYERYIGDNGLDVINLQYHTGADGYDPFYAQTPQATNARATEYRISTVPYSLVDGNYFSGQTNKLLSQHNVLGLRSLEDPGFKISVNTNYTTQPATVNVTVQAYEDIDTSDISLYISLLEQNAQGTGGASGQTQFSNVVRAMVPDAAGTVLSGKWDKGQFNQYVFDLPSDSRFKTSELTVVAYMQNIETKEIYQAAFDTRYRQVATAEHKIAEESKDKYYFYPNPTTQYLQVNAHNLANPSVVLSTIMGLTVDNTQGNSVYVGNLPAGTYQARLYEGTQLIKTEIVLIEN